MICLSDVWIVCLIVVVGAWVCAAFRKADRSVCGSAVMGFSVRRELFLRCAVNVKARDFGILDNFCVGVSLVCLWIG